MAPQSSSQVDYFFGRVGGRALGLTPPLAVAAEPIQVSSRDVRRRDLLGGLIHEYHGLAA